MEQRKRTNMEKWSLANAAESTLKMLKQKHTGERFLMKFKYFFYFLIILALIFVGSVFYIKTLFLAPSNDSKVIAFMVDKGSSITKISNNLKNAGLIKNALVFKYYVQFTGIQNKIQAGEFDLSSNLTVSQVIEKLKKGPSEILVTIPEGFRREEVAAKFTSILNKDEAFRQDFLNLSAGKEGYLFPESYLFPKEATASQIVNRMTTTFEKKVSDVTYKQLIVASLLERETFADSEKPIVAGIIYKRLENDWPLQIDATLQYIKGDWKPVYSIDKELNSPFNTYKNLGLPPSPICNPSLASILASISPESSDYWYYIHDNDGKIHFGKDLDEHNSNIRKYLD